MHQTPYIPYFLYHFIVVDISYFIKDSAVNNLDGEILNGRKLGPTFGFSSKMYIFAKESKGIY